MKTTTQRSQAFGPGRLTLSLAAAALVAGTPIHGARAQQVGSDQIVQVLDQAQDLYRELLPVAERIGDEGLLARMQSLRNQWVEARGHMQGRRYQLALRMAQTNLEQTRQVGGVLRRLAQRLPFYERMAERNREILRLLQQTAGTSGNPEMQRRLTMAADLVERAELARSRRRLVQAFRLMEQAEISLRQMLRQMDRGSLTRESVELEIRETQRRLERLRTMEDLSQNALETLERARMLQQEAVRQLAAGQLRLALSRTLTARSAIRLAAGLASGRAGPAEAADAIAHTEELMETYSGLASSEVPGVASLWEQAGRQLDTARTHLEAGRPRPAVESAQASAKLVITAARRAGMTGDEPPPSDSAGR